MKPVTEAKKVVKVLLQKGKSSLVEYTSEDLPERKYVPSSAVVNGTVACSVLDMGIPYGYPWREVQMQFDAVRFENEMHNAGVWTVQDALKHPQQVFNALHAMMSDTLAEVLNTASIEVKRSKNYDND